MSTTPESGALIAKRLAAANYMTYARANGKYGSLIAQYTEEFPKAFAVGHLTRVNPDLEPAPAPTTDRRRGFMFTPITTLASIGVAWENLDNPTTCMYSWGYDVNLHAKQLHEQQGQFFSSPDTDFWRCVYLRHVIGTRTFVTLWNARVREESTVYESLLQGLAQLKRQLPGWPITKLKRTVFIDCAYSFELSAQGGGTTSEGYWRFPVLGRRELTEVFR